MNSPQQDPGGPDEAEGASGGVLGARPLLVRTFHGRDPETVARPTICQVTPTKCQARTRLYRDGRLELEGFPVADISDYVDDAAVTIWLDLRDPDNDDLEVLSEEFGLHPLAVEDAVHERQRPKLDRYSSHLFLAAYGARLDAGGGYLLHGLLDYIVDGHFEAVQSLDDAVETLEDDLFADIPRSLDVQRRSFELRKSLVLLRRIVIPMREVVNALMRRDLHVVSDDMMPYYQDVYDHVLRAADWTDSLRDLVTTILETNLTIQGNRMSIITKKVTSWAAIIAVPTFVTGFYGMNVPYPGFSEKAGFLVSVGFMLVAGVLLYYVFKRRNWL